LLKSSTNESRLPACASVITGMPPSLLSDRGSALCKLCNLTFTFLCFTAPILPNLLMPAAGGARATVHIY